MHPLQGHWIANVAESRRHEHHQFHSALMRFDVAPGQVRLHYEGINASGHPEANTHTLHADGQPHEHPQAPGVVVVSMVGARRLESTAWKGDTVLGRGSYEVSEDGQMMTATVAGVDAGGKPFEQVIVFDRGE